MDSMTGRPQHQEHPDGSYIWLRYATQFRVGDRTHTIEMGIPVPIGASDEQRERLLREAEAGIEQLTNRVERRVARATQSPQASSASSAAPTSQSTQPAQRTQAAQTVSPSPKQVEPLTLSTPSTPPPASTPTPVPATTSMQDIEVVPSPASPTRETSHPPATTSTSGSSDKEVSVPPTRHSIGASMPSAPSASSDASGSMTLPQFIQYIKDSLGLTPKQAMELLNVKTLSGLNLRDALERLQALVARDAVSSAPTIPTPVVREPKAARPEAKTPAPSSPPSTQSAQPTQNPQSPSPSTSPTSSSNTTTSSQSQPPVTPSAPPKIPGIKEITNAVVRDTSTPYGFAEEIDLDGGEEDGIDLGTDEGIEFLPELTDQEREIAQELFNKLKEARGSSTASDARLRVLRNVVGDQVTDEQLLQIADAVWGVNTFKKLKSDQVEALISWAKQDDFINEVEMVQMLIQEGQYAGSDR